MGKGVNQCWNSASDILVSNWSRDAFEGKRQYYSMVLGVYGCILFAGYVVTVPSTSY